MRYPTDIPKSKTHNLLRWSGWLFLLLLSLPLAGQERSQLEEKRKKLIREINQTTQQLDQTKKNRETAVAQFLAIQSRIDKRQQLLQTLRQEIDLTNQSIGQASAIVRSLEADLSKLGYEYGLMARSALRQKLTKNALWFLFSAQSFNDAFKRWQLIRRFQQYRQKQVRLIQDTRTTLASRLTRLETSRQEKEALLASEQQQTALLQTELGQKNSILKKLSAEEVKLAKELDTRKKEHEQLNQAIEKIIRDEMARTRQAGRKETPAKPGEKAAPESPVGGAFSDRKGNLPLPVENGKVVAFFGKHPHPTLAGVQINNNGIDIETQPGAPVLAVFEGEVVGLQFIPGYSNMIILRHGDYYTVYSHLETVNVKRNQKVKTGEALGTVAKYKNTSSALVHFEVWQEKNRLDPLPWMAGN